MRRGYAIAALIALVPVLAAVRWTIENHVSSSRSLTSPQPIDNIDASGAAPVLTRAGKNTEPRVALVIGNGKYESSRLINPPNDADLISSTLRQLGFDVVERKNGDQNAMKRAIQDFGVRLDRAGPTAIGLFYYAGHGVQVGGKNYLIPISADIQRDADVDIEAVSADWVLDQMRAASNRLNIVILDACRNNPFARSWRSAGRGLAQMEATAGIFIAYSTAPGAVALDGDGTNSPFSAALARAMQAPAQEITSVFKATGREVQQVTGGKQIPWMSFTSTEDFYFVPGKPAVMALVGPPGAAPANGGRPAEAVATPTRLDSRVQSLAPAPVAAPTSVQAPASAFASARAPAAALAPAPAPAPARVPAASTARPLVANVQNARQRNSATAMAAPFDDYCDKPVGSWSMGGAHAKGRVAISANHTVQLLARNGTTTGTGTWNCNTTSRRIQFAWANGAVDSVAMTSAKNTVMQGTDQHTHKVVYKRAR